MVFPKGVPFGSSLPGRAPPPLPPPAPCAALDESSGVDAVDAEFGGADAEGADDIRPAPAGTTPVLSPVVISRAPQPSAASVAATPSTTAC